VAGLQQKVFPVLNQRGFLKFLVGVEHIDYDILEQYVKIAVQETYISNEITLITQNNLLLCRF